MKCHDRTVAALAVSMGTDEPDRSEGLPSEG